MRRRLHNTAATVLLLLPLVAVMCTLLVWPSIALLRHSVRQTDPLDTTQPAAGFTLSYYLQIFTDPANRHALENSLAISLAVAAASTLLCLGPAWLLVRRTFRGKRFVRAVFTLPMSFSGIIVGFLAVLMLGRNGFIPRLSTLLFGHAYASGIAYQLTGLLLAYMYFEIPRATLTLESALRKFDFRMDLAARALGARWGQRMRWVLLPTLWPALLSTFAITFSVSLGSFGVALILSRKESVLPLEAFRGWLNNPPLAAAMSVLLAALAFAVNFGMRAATVRREETHG